MVRNPQKELHMGVQVYKKKNMRTCFLLKLCINMLLTT